MNGKYRRMLTTRKGIVSVQKFPKKQSHSWSGSEQADRFAALEAGLGGTPLHEIARLPIPNGNRVLAKLEFRNPTGSHYDRVYVALLKTLEERGDIQPGRDHLMEVTSGNAGAAFAWVCREVGYAATVVVPDTLPAARIQAIAQYGAKVLRIPGYIPDCVERLPELLRGRPPAPAEQYRCPNHSRRPEAAAALESLAHEAIEQASTRIDYFVAAVGNGISILGPGRVLKERFGTTVVAWDPLAGPDAFEKKYPCRYRSMFGLEPGALGPHRIFGTGVLGVEFPLLDEALGLHGFPPVIDEVQLVADEDALSRLAYAVQKGSALPTALAAARSLPDLSSIHSALACDEGMSVGYSSAGSLALALKLCERERDRIFLVIFYDDFGGY